MTGAVLALSHVAFGPFILPSIQALLKGEPRPGTIDLNDTLEEWLWIHTVRSWTVDLGAWLALAIAACRALKAS